MIAAVASALLDHELVKVRLHAPDDKKAAAKVLLDAGHVIGVAEDSGLIVEIGTFVLTEVCRQLYAWRQAGS